MEVPTPQVKVHINLYFKTSIFNPITGTGKTVRGIFFGSDQLQVESTYKPSAFSSTNWFSKAVGGSLYPHKTVAIALLYITFSRLRHDKLISVSCIACTERSYGKLREYSGSERRSPGSTHT